MWKSKYIERESTYMVAVIPFILDTQITKKGIDKKEKHVHTLFVVNTEHFKEFSFDVLKSD